MNYALGLAKKAEEADEVPVGAVILLNQKIIATGYNQKHATNQVSKHAEMIAIEEACRKLGNWRLKECQLVVTLEPCLMCSGALSQARIKKVTYGTKDPKAGALGSLYHVHSDKRLNHQFEIEVNILQEQCSNILKDFFKKKRSQKEC